MKIVTLQLDVVPTRLLTPLAAVTLHGFGAINRVNAGFGAHFCLAARCKVVAATGEAGEGAVLHVARTSLTDLAILRSITNFVVRQLIDAATGHVTVAGQL